MWVLFGEYENDFKFQDWSELMQSGVGFYRVIINGDNCQCKFKLGKRGTDKKIVTGTDNQKMSNVDFKSYIIRFGCFLKFSFFNCHL